MTNESAIKRLKPLTESPIIPISIAAKFAIHDIICDDVEVWVDTPVHENLWCFVKFLDAMSDKKFQGLSHEKQIRMFKNSSIGICTAMYHYTKIHSEIKEESLSER